MGPVFEEKIKELSEKLKEQDIGKKTADINKMVDFLGEIG